jgi:hypothetical protein
MRPRPLSVDAAVSQPPLRVIALNRIGFGPRRSDLNAFLARGLTDSDRLIAYVNQQLDPASIDDSATDALITSSDYSTLNKTRKQLGKVREPMREVSEAMAAFYQDLDGGGEKNFTKSLTVVVMSESGRRLSENADRGLDHGHGSVMMVMGGNTVRGVHGNWPGLRHDQLYDGADVAVTTDYRRVLSEILINRMGNDAIDQVFPGYTGYKPLGVVAPGEEALQLFNDGFEKGDASAWNEEFAC